MKVFQDQKNPERIIVESYPFTSYYIIVRDTNSKPCEPWVREEAAMMDTRRMEARDQISLANHRRWALLNATKKAKELAKAEELAKAKELALPLQARF